MAKNIASRSGTETDRNWKEYKDDSAWRARYDKFRAKGMSYPMAVEAAMRKSSGGSVASMTASGKTRRTKTIGTRETIPVDPKSNISKGQGKVKGNSIKGATARAKTRNEGEAIAKAAWKSVSTANAESWKSLSFADKARLALKVIPASVNGEVAAGVVRAISTRATGGQGADAATKVIADWASDKGVGDPSGEMTTAKSNGRQGSKARSRRSGRGNTGQTEPSGKIPTAALKNKTTAAAQLDAATERLSGIAASALKPDSRISNVTGEPPIGSGIPRKAKAAKISIVVETKSAKTGAIKGSTGEIDPQTKRETKEVYVWERKGSYYVYDASRRKYIKYDKKGAIAALSTLENEPTNTVKPKKPATSPAKMEFPGKMELLSEVGRVTNKEFTESTLREAYSKVKEKFKEANKKFVDKMTASGATQEQINAAMKGRGAPSVPEVAAALGFTPNTKEEWALIRAVQRTNKMENRERAAARRAEKPATGKKPRRTSLRNTGEQQREAFIASEDRRVRNRAVPKAKPAEIKSVFTKAGAEAMAKAVVAGKKVPDSAIPSGKRVKKVRGENFQAKIAVPRVKREKPFSIRDSALSQLTSKEDKRSFRAIEDLHKSGFKPTRVRELLAGNKRITPNARRVAKGLGYMNIATIALGLLDSFNEKKK